MSLTNTLVTKRLKFQNQVFLSLDIVGCHFINPMGGLFPVDTSVVPVEVCQKAVADIATTNVHPSVRLEKAINTYLPWPQSFNVRTGERPWTLLLKGHSCFSFLGRRPLFLAGHGCRPFDHHIPEAELCKMLIAMLPAMQDLEIAQWVVKHEVEHLVEQTSTESTREEP